jgi:hypothetical protein
MEGVLPGQPAPSHPGPGLSRAHRPGLPGAEAGSELVYSPPTAVLCCCTRLEPYRRQAGDVSGTALIVEDMNSPLSMTESKVMASCLRFSALATSNRAVTPHATAFPRACSMARGDMSTPTASAPWAAASSVFPGAASHVGHPTAEQGSARQADERRLRPTDVPQRRRAYRVYRVPVRWQRRHHDPLPAGVQDPARHTTCGTIPALQVCQDPRRMPLGQDGKFSMPVISATQAPGRACRPAS